MSLHTQYNALAKDFSDSVNLPLISRNVFYKILGTRLKRKKLLDVGCGDGTDLIYYEKLGAKVSGVDASEEFIAIAKSKLPDAILEVDLFDHLPFKNKSFDIVLSKYALQTGKQIAPSLHEIVRVARRGATILFLVVHPLRQFLEKKSKFKDYYKQETVDSVLFRGSMVVHEPSHTFAEYFPESFLKKVQLVYLTEGSDFSDTGAQQVKGDYYPTFMICKFIKL